MKGQPSFAFCFCSEFYSCTVRLVLAMLSKQFFFLNHEDTAALFSNSQKMKKQRAPFFFFFFIFNGLILITFEGYLAF